MYYKLLSKENYPHPEGAYIKNNKFYWVDIKKKLIASTNQNFNFKTKFTPTVILEKKNSGLIVGTDVGIFYTQSEYRNILKVSFQNIFDYKKFRTNDGCKIKANTYLLGTMPIKNMKLDGTIYLIENKNIYDLNFKIKIPNTFIQIQNNTFLISDSHKKKIYKIKIDLKKKKIISKKIFASFQNEIPDGGCIINKYFIAIAIWNRPYICILNNSGKLVKKINIACKNLSNCRYIDNLDKLMITSPLLVNRCQKKYPLSGKVFYVKGVRELLNNNTNT